VLFPENYEVNVVWTSPLEKADFKQYEKKKRVRGTDPMI
jgi:hypothetical protein